MKLNQNDKEYLLDTARNGGLTADQVTVEMVKMQRVRLITGRLPAQVRKALNAAVKRGYLGHMKKDGHKPEAYYSPPFDYLARSERNHYEKLVLKSLAGVVARPNER